MAHISGKLGQVDAAAEVTGIRDWTLDYTVDMHETTDFHDAGVASYLPGVSRWSGSFSGLKDGVPLALGVSSTPITIKLYESQTASQFWTGDAFITSVKPTTSESGLVEYSYDFQGTGPLTVAAA